MKIQILAFFLMIFMLTAYGQNQQPSFSSNPSLPFDKFISGVKYAEIVMSDINQEQVDNKTGIAGFYFLAQKYLQEMGFEYVALTSSEKTKLNISIRSYCEYAQVMFGGDINKNAISNMNISFASCNGDIYSFTSDKKFNYGKFADVEKKLLKDWKSIINTKIAYQVSNQLQLPANPTKWTKENISQYLYEHKGKLDPIEGIYERVRLSFEDINGGKYTVGVIKNPDAEGYMVIYLSGAINASDWKSSEIKTLFYSTATKGFYSVDWIARDKSLYEDVYCKTDAWGFNVYSTGIVSISYKFIKISPIYEGEK